MSFFFPTNLQVARKVLENTRHSLLVGDLATEFAIQMGFTEETLQTDASKEKWTKWRDNNCQPNFWTVRKSSINFFSLSSKARPMVIFTALILHTWASQEFLKKDKVYSTPTPGPPSTTADIFYQQLFFIPRPPVPHSGPEVDILIKFCESLPKIFFSRLPTVNS